MAGGWLYIMTNGPNGTLYVGVTADLKRRVHEHRTGDAGGFTKRYRLTLLVYAEAHETIQAAIQRETSIKRWPRAWKLRTIHALNPDRRDLYDDLT